MAQLCCHGNGQQFGKFCLDLAVRTGGDMIVAALEHAAYVGLVGLALTQLLHGELEASKA